MSLVPFIIPFVKFLTGANFFDFPLEVSVIYFESEISKAEDIVLSSIQLMLFYYLLAFRLA
jgi:hypothetical protein